MRIKEGNVDKTSRTKMKRTSVQLQWRVKDRVVVWLLCLVLAAGQMSIRAGAASNDTSPSPSASASPSKSPSRSASPSITPSRSTTPTISSSESATPSRRSSESATPSRTSSESATPSRTSSESATPSRTSSESATPSRTSSESATPSRTPSESSTPSRTPSESATPSRTPSETATPSRTPSESASPSRTPSESATPSRTPSESATPSRTPSETITPSKTPSETSTPSYTPSESATASESPSKGIAASGTPSMSSSPSMTTRAASPSPTPTSTGVPRRQVFFTKSTVTTAEFCSFEKPLGSSQGLSTGNIEDRILLGYPEAEIDGKEQPTILFTPPSESCAKDEQVLMSCPDCEGQIGQVVHMMKDSSGEVLVFSSTGEEMMSLRFNPTSDMKNLNGTPFAIENCTLGVKFGVFGDPSHLNTLTLAIAGQCPNDKVTALIEWDNDQLDSAKLVDQLPVVEPVFATSPNSKYLIIADKGKTDEFVHICSQKEEVTCNELRFPLGVFSQISSLLWLDDEVIIVYGVSAETGGNLASFIFLEEEGGEFQLQSTEAVIELSDLEDAEIGSVTSANPGASQGRIRRLSTSSTLGVYINTASENGRENFLHTVDGFRTFGEGETIERSGISLKLGWTPTFVLWIATSVVLIIAAILVLFDRFRKTAGPQSDGKQFQIEIDTEQGLKDSRNARNGVKSSSSPTDSSSPERKQGDRKTEAKQGRSPRRKAPRDKNSPPKLHSRTVRRQLSKKDQFGSKGHLNPVHGSKQSK